MFDFSCGSSLICFRISYCVLKIWSDVSHDTYCLLDDESIMILCCLSRYVFLKCCSYFSYCLLLWYHCSWNIFCLLDKESIKSLFLFFNQYFLLFVVIFSLKCRSYSSCCLLLWSHFLETTSVWWTRNPSRIFFRYFILLRIYGVIFS